ncbi:MAG TPA: glycosyltransferase family 4 protein [Rubricoccaceae bacterium]|jgi:glycosyltransferase involved in cell wall biosynthesis
MHVAFVSPFGAHDGRSWSGIPLRMHRALAAHVDRVSVVTPLSFGPTVSRATARAVASRLRGRPHSRYHTVAAADALAEQTADAIARLRPDAVLSPSSLPFARLEQTGIPVAFWTDLTFEAAMFLYDGYAALPDADIAEALRLDTDAIRRSHAFYASAYAARSAIAYSGADPEHVRVVPFGANLDIIPTEAEVAGAIGARPAGACDMLFLGVDWYRKGGDVAVQVADALNASGVPATLSVVGCTPVLDQPRPYVHLHGFVSKATVEGRAKIEHLLATSHLLMMPVRAEAFGCVFCEASAYGVPSVTTRSGGAGSAVMDGENGLVFEPRASAAEIAARVEALVRDRNAYQMLARRSRAVFDERLNWHAATGAVAARLAEVA